MNLVPKFMYQWMIDARRHVLITPQECPAELSNIVLVSIKGQTNYIACTNYERARGISDMPSAEYCPTCQYNTDNVRKKADERLEKSVADFVSSQR
jgi:ssDNA-binding Zn-finger/Zn-ribbon topoisomerase 1